MQPDLSTRYQSMEGEREGWLHLGRRNSALTLPGIVPQTDGRRSTQARERPIPHNNLGAQGVNTLAAKMVLQLLPPSQPFFRLEIKPEALKEIESQTSGGGNPGLAETIHNELQTNLVDLENRLVREVGRDNIRSVSFEAFKHLLVAGNVVMHLPEKGLASVIDLRNFVVERDPSGSLLILIIKEEIAPVAMSQELRDAVGLGQLESGEEKNPLLKPVAVYTGLERVSESKVKVWQEIGGHVVPGSEKTYDEEKSPYMVLRGTESSGDHYGEAFVSNFEGDLIVLEGLSRAIKEAAIASSMLIFGVSPNAAPGLEHEITRAQNGKALRFNQSDVFALQVNKMGDLSIAANAASAAEQRLRQAFLLNSTRDAERVTAEEIRQNFAELQQALGGTFALLGDIFQKPLLARMMIRLKKRGGLSGIENALNEVEPILITGVDAIGRNSELNNMLSFTQILKEGLGEAKAAEIIDPIEFATRAANATSVKPDGLIRNPEQLQEQQQNDLTADAVRSAAGPAAGAAVKGMADQAAAPPQAPQGEVQ